eukprot:CAMPEP_0113531946 /NCGR_PEP_ID=MMETSP0015_2-20120614/3777_1 /TAXON_ID=2838 /ORGANISM="Odontella" /LENGTH=922 /DNA_ID=CAMNT_0000430835 /DNA_START=642 /DNA_END=3410 /DNA_ORIENTATION=+ /assembly_acc=CAM_ASM_000160
MSVASNGGRYGDGGGAGVSRGGGFPSQHQQTAPAPAPQTPQQEQQQLFRRFGANAVLGGLPVMRPTRESVLRRLSEALMRRSLTMIDMSQRGLQPSDARLVKLALLQNASLSVLKLGYNNLCDEGAITLASGIAVHGALKSLDLGFNNVGNEGCMSLASSLLSTRATLHTLYLAGNSIGENGARALADVISQGCGLRRLHLTGNKIGSVGVKYLVDAFVEDEVRRNGGLPQQEWGGEQCAIADVPALLEPQAHPPLPQPQAVPLPAVSSSQSSSHQRPVQQRGVKELFLGGTDMGRQGCVAVARLLETSASLRVLSLANCDLGDEEAEILAESIKRNRGRLPLESLQLSFNRLTCRGVEALMNAVWGSKTLRELRLDNNVIGDRGAQVVSAVLSSVQTLTKLDLGFNSITSGGMKALMKAVAESQNLSSLSISGNAIDTGAAKAVAYALAYNRSLKLLFLDHCSVGHEGQRHVTAGIVSNSGTCLHTLTGFRIGINAVSLGLPPALEQWTNEQVLKFIHLMWERMQQDQQQCSTEKDIDPLHLLPSVPGAGNPKMNSGPLDPATVVAVAKRAYASLGDNGSVILSRQAGRPLEPSFESPLSEDAIMLESSGESNGAIPSPQKAQETSSANDPTSMDVGESSYENLSNLKISVDVANASAAGQRSPPPSPDLSFAERRKRIVEWLCHNIQHLNELSQLPFNSSELWRLHQHFFTPSIQDHGGGTSGAASPCPNSMDGNFHSAEGSSMFSQPHAVSASTTQSSDGHIATVPVSEPSLQPHLVAQRYMGTLPMLKRKVSYRFLNDAMLTSSHSAGGRPEGRFSDKVNNGRSISKMIEDASGQSMQPKSKRARRNRTRISFLPRVKSKVDSYLDACHQKALVLMRQLQFVEQALIRGNIYPLESGAFKHLSGTLASDAEMILIDMM